MIGSRVLVVGAGVAGCSVAYWLRRHGFVPTVVERAPALRPGGHDVDVRDTTLDVLERMGVLDELRALQTPRRETIVLDRDGRHETTLPPEQFGGEVEVDHADLTAVLARAIAGVEVSFGDTVTALVERDDDVEATFTHGTTRAFDLVVGADGQHSVVRDLVFGPESSFTDHLGMIGAGFRTPNLFGRDDRMWFYRVPGASVGVACRADRDDMEVVAAVADDGAAGEIGRRDLSTQKAVLTERLSGLGWEVPRLLDALADAPDLYCEVMARIRLPTWTRGRVTLLGDAAACSAPTSGRGTSQAVVGAYVLAGELATHDDHATALAAYERRLRPWFEQNQRLGVAGARWFLSSEESEEDEAGDDGAGDDGAGYDRAGEGGDVPVTVELPDYAPRAV